MSSTIMFNVAGTFEQRLNFASLPRRNAQGQEFFVDTNCGEVAG